jgi:diguanylate cyclase (GGDEF)-like protein
VTPAASLSDESRHQVRRIVFVSRLAGVLVAATLGTLSLYIHWGHLTSVESLAQLLTVVVGLGAFVSISTLSRIGHARVLEESMTEVAQLSDELRNMAERDPLTGLCNQRAFTAALDVAIDASRADGSPLSLIVADLDNFKLLNDSYGHQYGDLVLIDVAHVFSSLDGGDAVAARLGGDEFAVILPHATRREAVARARMLEERLADLRTEGQAATLGSFGIGTFPADGDSAQALFSAADGRMYSEKHRRKAESLATLAGASRKLFVRAGRAMRPDHSTERILNDIVLAATEEFSLLGCAILVAAHEGYPSYGVSRATPEAAAAFDVIDASALAGASQPLAQRLPPDAWIIDTAIPDELGEAGRLILAGVPTRSFRPDAPVVVALADLVQAVVANSRAHEDAQRAGRERDIHIELARALAGAGSLEERLSAVTATVTDFMGASSVSVEGLPSQDADTPTYSLIPGATPAFLDQWERARFLPESRGMTSRLAREAPCIIEDIATTDMIPDLQRALLTNVGVRSGAVAAIKFDGESLGILAAVSRRAGFFTQENLAVLVGIADHMAPVMKVALLREQLEASFRELEQANRESLARLADAAEARDPHTAGHLRRIGRFSYALARELSLSEVEATAIAEASAVHDLGKLSLPDEILMKPGKLSEDDWALMRLHPQHGERLIGDSPRFAVERVIARSHHERWDGTGYPDGLRGEQIPLAARIVAVADAFDALTTERPYKPAWSVDDACREIAATSGTLFCPAVVQSLEALWSSGRLARLFAEVEEAHAHARAA